MVLFPCVALDHLLLHMLHVRHQFLLLENKHQRAVTFNAFLRFNPKLDLVIHLAHFTTRINKTPEGHTQLLHLEHVLNFQEVEDLTPHWRNTFFIWNHFVGLFTVNNGDHLKNVVLYIFFVRLRCYNQSQVFCKVLDSKSTFKFIDQVSVFFR